MGKSLPAVVALVTVTGCATLQGQAATPAPTVAPAAADPWAAFTGRWRREQAIDVMGPPTYAWVLPGGGARLDWVFPYRAQELAYVRRERQRWTTRAYHYPWISFGDTHCLFGEVTRWRTISCTFDARGVLERGQTFDR